MHELPGRRELVPYSRMFSSAEWDALQRGFVPGQMEDHWGIEFDGAACALRLWRSWSGFCIFEVRLRGTADGGGEALEMWANRDPQQFRRANPAADATDVNRLIDGILLAP